MACLHFSSVLKYIVISMMLSNFEKSIIISLFFKLYYKDTKKSSVKRLFYTYNVTNFDKYTNFNLQSKLYLMIL
jgi:hypothetical protein